MTVPDIHRGVLDNLLDGVLVVGSGGRIETLNPAAERILGLEPDEASGRTFGELFIAREGFDAFTQLLIDARNRSMRFRARGKASVIPMAEPGKPLIGELIFPAAGFRGSAGPLAPAGSTMKPAASA